MKKSAHSWFTCAQARSQAGHTKGALAALDRAIQADPSLAIAFFARADLYRSQGEPQRALADYDQALALQPDMPLAYIGRGNARRNLGDAIGALTDMQHAVQLDPKNPAAHVGLGLARSDQDAALALQDFARALRLNPDYAEAYFARALCRLGTKASLTDLSRTIQRNPQHAMAYLYRGEYYSKHRASARALADYTRAIELGVPAATHAYAKRAVVHLERREYAATLADCDRELRANRNFAMAYFLRGNAQVGQGEATAAYASLQRALALDPSLQSAAKGPLWVIGVLRSLD